MAAPLPLSADLVDLVGRFVAALRSAGLTPWRTTEQAARTFCGRLQRAGGWVHLSRARQFDATKKAPAFAAWLMVTGQLTVSADFLGRAGLRLGITARHYCPDAHSWFVTAAERLGIRSEDTMLQWSTLAKITALTGVAPNAIGPAEFERARTAIVNAFIARGSRCAGRTMAATFHRLQLTLFHAGHLTTYKRPRNRPPVSMSGWTVVAPGFAEVARRYVDQIALSLRPSTVEHIEHDLREFGTWLADYHPQVASCADLARHHIEQFKAWLATKLGRRTRKPLHRISIKNRLINLHCFSTGSLTGATPTRRNARSCSPVISRPSTSLFHDFSTTPRPPSSSGCRVRIRTRSPA